MNSLFPLSFHVLHTHLYVHLYIIFKQKSISGNLAIFFFSVYFLINHKQGCDTCGHNHYKKYFSLHYEIFATNREHKKCCQGGLPQRCGMCHWAQQFLVGVSAEGRKEGAVFLYQLQQTTTSRVACFACFASFPRSYFQKICLSIVGKIRLFLPEEKQPPRGARAVEINLSVVV